MNGKLAEMVKIVINAGAVGIAVLSLLILYWFARETAGVGIKALNNNTEALSQMKASITENTLQAARLENLINKIR